MTVEEIKAFAELQQTASDTAWVLLTATGIDKYREEMRENDRAVDVACLALAMLNKYGGAGLEGLLSEFDEHSSDGKGGDV